MRYYSRCYSVWCRCPTWMQMFLLFFLGNIIGDLLAFPFVHTFWNLMHFEGWFLED